MSCLVFGSQTNYNLTFYLWLPFSSKPCLVWYIVQAKVQQWFVVGFNDCVPLCETSCTNLHLGVKLVYRLVFPLLSSVFHSSMCLLVCSWNSESVSIGIYYCLQESLLSLSTFNHVWVLFMWIGYDMLLTQCALLFNWNLCMNFKRFYLLHPIFVVLVYTY